MQNLHALVLGATGATGREIVNLLLNDDAYGKVSIFVRSKPRIKHKKLIIHEINFSKLNDYFSLVNGDVFFSAFGTTLKDAGNKAQQYLVDYTYQYEFARMASENGIKHYLLVSSVGSNKNSPFFYSKIKGALENAIIKLGFEKTYIFQPPFLIRQPDLIRPVEKKGLKALKLFNQIGLLKSQRPLLVSDLAKKMIDVIKLDNVGVKIYKPTYIFSNTI